MHDVRTVILANRNRAIRFEDPGIRARRVQQRNPDLAKQHALLVVRCLC
jgi:hypothetical protein